MILSILRYPDKRLRTKATKVIDFNDDIKSLVSNMLETMYTDGGVGLAATQVDSHLRVFVVDCGTNNGNKTNDGEKNPLCFINPKIISLAGETINEEGCLSVPEYYAKIKRAEIVKVQAFDENGIEFELAAEGLLATCIQHEVDHLNGILFVDYLSKLKKIRLLEKIRKQIKN